MWAYQMDRLRMPISSFSMSVCVSVVSAGVSVVLIKYTGNVWLQLTFERANHN